MLLAIVVSGAHAEGPLIIAHRGASADAPENTLAAFRLAWEKGADGIEGDFRLTADGRVVCIHDEDTKRVAGKRLVVKDTTYAELKTLDAGAQRSGSSPAPIPTPVPTPMTIPTLEEVLAIVPEGKLLLIELKTGPEIVVPLANVLNRGPLSADQIVIIAFDERVITACGEQLPNIRRHLLVDYRQQKDGTWKPTADEVIAAVRRTRADGLGTQNRPTHINQEFVRRLQAARIDEFHIWTVDDPHEARGYQQLGAWALTTNRPAELRAALGRGKR